MHRQSWPSFSYEMFHPTAHLLHMGLQAIGKLKLATPFEPHWSNVPLWLTTRGLTTGLIPHQQGFFSVEVDFTSHEVICTSSRGALEKFPWVTMSVATFVDNLFNTLLRIGIATSINMLPQEIPHPIPFNEDKAERLYDAQVINAWWQVLLSSYHVLQRYHAHFSGASPSVGLMWGTLDLRDARYTERKVATTGVNAGYIRRNAMDVAQVEAGWWAGNEAYPHAAYFSFTYPQPEDIENAKIKPKAAHWNATLGEFILHYADVQQAKSPAEDLYAFLESSYQAGTKLAHWDANLITKGEPA